MSEHQALYRKYRPETFKDVVGQPHIVDLLSKALAQKKVAHAYLFCGGRGTGKTTVARIVARDLGCNPEDIIEIDAASNRGIDEIRELRDAVRSMPFSSPYKVYIIDEAHMLTKEASNALLKTLEEPPSHVIFILATTDPDKLPQTIVSRCQKVEFKQPSLEVLASHLTLLAKKEGKKMDTQAATLIASLGHGSYRDALGILDQALLRVEDKEITSDIASALFGTPDYFTLLEILEALCAKNAQLIISSLSLLKERGVSAETVYKELVEYFRIALLMRIGEKSATESLSSDVVVRIGEIVKAYPAELSSGNLLKLIEQEKYFSLSYANPYTVLEMILLEYVGN